MLSEDIEYHMHGAGCVVEFSDFDVDFDFANWEEVGFDAWRLWRYAKQFPERYPDYQERESVEAALADGLAERVITPFEGNDRLFKLKMDPTDSGQFRGHDT
jgi:hypothetical protein